ncbi:MULTISPECIES: hypothetical protein [unclassified Arthrobacter]|uniref:hypothetical protein n=1 Tax=unclassified Arthrobacter TaxID=235627 RepID=UPI0024E02A23|nr:MULTISPECIES: hypothetical protein [unclassified Arthrobacter]MCC9144111.1 hypothetical protein [Arthrobacter sp. zg-Y919]MDK1275336.1 hypothetical protein [Arthrobacter sp. zg.Y919]WIB03274.1 hypothetical protein QNO10_00810 [Arthrobacter sp. zg-Y919]
MNATPRALNRFLLGLLGLVLMGIGGGLALISAWPAAARAWHGFAADAGPAVSSSLDATALPGGRGSWIWVALALLSFLGIVLMVVWMAGQGGGRTGTLVSEYDDDGAPGRVEISGTVAEQALRSALQENPDVAASSVNAYSVKGRSALRVRITPRQGAAPHLIAADATALVETLDTVLGHQTPVLLSLEAGRRLRFGREDRVR